MGRKEKKDKRKKRQFQCLFKWRQSLNVKLAAVGIFSQGGEDDEKNNDDNIISITGKKNELGEEDTK